MLRSPSFAWRSDVRIAVGVPPLGGLQTLPPEGGTPTFPGLTEATDVSADGNVVVGHISKHDTRYGFRREATHWEDGVSTGLGGLISLSDTADLSLARAVSADGAVVVGYSQSINDNQSHTFEAFRWEDGTMVGLGFLPGDVESEAVDVSADGSRIVGISYWSVRAFLWVNGEIMDLGVPPWDTYQAPSVTARAISADGSTIVGNVYNGGDFENDYPASAFLWRDGMFTQLHAPPGMLPPSTYDVSYDGSRIVGVSEGWVTLWDERYGYEPILTDLGEDSIRSLKISADGSTVVGASSRITISSDWSGHPIANDQMDVDTGDFMGWINVTHGDYIWSYSLDGWMYCPEPDTTDSGAWMYVFNTPNQ